MVSAFKGIALFCLRYLKNQLTLAFSGFRLIYLVAVFTIFIVAVFTEL
jgi:hypothetical protein